MYVFLHILFGVVPKQKFLLKYSILSTLQPYKFLYIQIFMHFKYVLKSMVQFVKRQTNM
jgi:hypothetical protein